MAVGGSEKRWGSVMGVTYYTVLTTCTHTPLLVSFQTYWPRSHTSLEVWQLRAKEMSGSSTQVYFEGVFLECLPLRGRKSVRLQIHIHTWHINMPLLVPMQFRHQALWDAARLKGHSKPTTDTEGTPLHYKERLKFAIKTKKNISN